MRVSAVDHTEPAVLPEGGAIAIEQRTSRLAPVWLAATGLLASVFLALPFLLLATSAVGRPEVRDIFAERPQALIQLAVGLMLSLAALCYVARRLIALTTHRRSVLICEDWIQVTDHGLLGTTQWSAPLASFRGVARGVRASLSGSRDEIVLVHAEPRQSVLLEMAPRLPAAALPRIADRLGLPMLETSSVAETDRREFPDLVSAGRRLMPQLG